MAKLAAYRAKRNFGSTSEPEGEEGAPGRFSFVIQKHAASRLHYDLRLELDGVMKSWAVAKGPSLVPGEKRLAVHVEDHPIDYNTFEGTIPKGQYGGGTVLLWDRGTWAADGDPHRGLAKGHLEFRLAGEKLSGAWHLVRMKPRPREKQEAWLLIKSDDEAARPADAPDILEELPLSIASGRSLDEIAAAADGAVWQSNRGMAAEARAGNADALPSPLRGEAGGRGPSAESPAVPLARPPPRTDASRRLGPPRKGEGKRRVSAKPVDAMPDAIEPCLATLVANVPAGDLWIHEIKWDGYRLVAFKTAGKVRLATRRGLDWTSRFPGIAEALGALPVDTAILDGEAVIEDANGMASFSALQNALSDEHGRVATNAVFYAFDLLYLDGEDLRALPLESRKARLQALLPVGAAGTLRLGEYLEADGEAMVRSACRLGLEGIISKRRDRPYRSGRSEDWLKIKCSERQEFVIAGYVPATASRRAVGSLVLAYHEDGKLRLAGRCGTGYTAEAARALWKRLDPLARATSPLTAKPNADEKRGVAWVEPELVAEIEFRGWTGEDRLRHAAYKGLREDKVASEVVRERPLGDNPSPEPPAAAARAAPRRHGAAEVAGVTLTHPDRELWAEDGITKQGLAEFYEAIAEWLLPHLVDRPLSLVRCPGGTAGKCFFQKHSWAGLSDSILREMVRDEGGEEEILYVRDLAGIVTLVQASVLEIHPWGATVADVDRPDRITMDLDPGDDVSYEEVIAGARDVRERLSAQGLESFVKTTGGKGLHVVVPLTGRAGWPEVKGFAKSLADGMEADAPRRYIAKASKSARRGLIYIDYLRNGRGATAVAAYSTRARPNAPVSVPLRWEELSASLPPNHFTIANLPARLAGLDGDPWADLFHVRQDLPATTTSGRRRTRPR